MAYAGVGGKKAAWFESDVDVDGNVLFRKADIPDSVQKVGPNYPRNAQYAGKVYYPEDLPAKIKSEHPNLHLDYPDGVRFNERGYVEFTPYATHIVKLDKFTPGNHRSDVRRANIEAAKLDPNFKESKSFTWHHHEDGTTMEYIPRDLHDAYQHTGGMSTTKHGVNFK